MKLEEIKHIELTTTKACNMRCTYCYEKKDKKSVFTKETADNIIDLVKNYSSIESITLFGGESLLPEIADDIMKFLKDLYDVRNNIVISIITNGYETKKVEHILDYIADNFEELQIQFSLDGCKEAHDICRKDLHNNGTFDDVLNNVMYTLDKYKDRENVHIHIHHVVSLENIKYLVETVCLDNELIKMFKNYRCSYNSEHSIHTEPHDEEALLDMLEQLHQIYLNGDLHPLIWDSLLNVDDYLWKQHSRCAFTRRNMAVDPNGNCSPCHFFTDKDKHVYYNVNTKEINEEAYAKTKAFEEDSNIVSELGRDCSTCPGIGFCAYCAASSYVQTNYKDKTIVGATACSFAYTIANWTIQTYNDGVRPEPNQEFLNNGLELLQRIANTLDKNPNDEKLSKVFLKLRIKYRLYGADI